MGDKVVTTSGVIGTIANVKKNRFVVKISDNTFPPLSHRIHAHNKFVSDGVVRILSNPYHLLFGVIASSFYGKCEGTQAIGRCFIGKGILSVLYR